nr:hypothetical protein CFP56_16924 [Quercus suber]
MRKQESRTGCASKQWRKISAAQSQGCRNWQDRPRHRGRKWHRSWHRRSFCLAGAATLILAARRAGPLEETKAGIAKLAPECNVLVVPDSDITDAASLTRLFAGLPTAPDVVVSNAGVYSGTATVADADPERGDAAWGHHDAARHTGFPTGVACPFCRYGTACGWFGGVSQYRAGRVSDGQVCRGRVGYGGAGKGKRAGGEGESIEHDGDRSWLLRSVEEGIRGFDHQDEGSNCEHIVNLKASNSIVIDAEECACAVPVITAVANLPALSRSPTDINGKASWLMTQQSVLDNHATRPTRASGAT